MAQTPSTPEAVVAEAIQMAAAAVLPEVKVVVVEVEGVDGLVFLL